MTSYTVFYTKFRVIILLPNFMRASYTHTALFAIKGSNNKKTNKTKKKKRNKPLQDKSNTTGQHNSILGLIFSTQSTNDIAVLLCLTFLAMVYFASFSLFFCYLLLLPLMANTVVYSV